MLQHLKTLLSEKLQKAKKIVTAVVKDVEDFLFFTYTFGEIPFNYKKNNIKINDWVLLDFRRKNLSAKEYYEIVKIFITKNIDISVSNDTVNIGVNKHENKKYLLVKEINDSGITCYYFNNYSRYIVNIPNLKNLILTKNNESIRNYIKYYLIPEHFKRCGDMASIQHPSIISKQTIKALRNTSKNTFYSQLELYLYYKKKSSINNDVKLLQKIMEYPISNIKLVYRFIAICVYCYFNIKHKILKHE